MFAGLQPPCPLVPYYMVKSKSPVDANAPSNASYVKFDKAPKDSFRVLEEERVLTSFKESIVQTWQGPGRLESPASSNAPGAAPGPGGLTNLDHVKQLPAKPFEMPDGWNTVFGAERFKVAESLFDHNAAYTDATHPKPAAEQTLTMLAHKALQACDVDVRTNLLHNVVLTGAGSLIEKLADRLSVDLQAMYPNPKVRVIASSNSVERKYGAWIGGSVLSSLGTFHQMWISREEYNEFGSAIVEKRCK
nr:actin-related protein 4 [Quercus suber]